jgi:hypothetical protein
MKSASIVRMEKFSFASTPNFPISAYLKTKWPVVFRKGNSFLSVKTIQKSKLFWFQPKITHKFYPILINGPHSSDIRKLFRKGMFCKQQTILITIFFRAFTHT